MSKLLQEVNKVVVLQKEISGKMTEIIGIMDRRNEANYGMICDLSDKVRCLEEYLGVEFKPEVTKEVKRYAKRK